MDPYQFRLQNISTAPVNDGASQWRDALVGVAQARELAAARRGLDVKQTRDVATGRGIAIGGFAGSQAGVVAEIEVNMKHRQDHGQAHVRGAGRRPHRLPRRASRTRSRAT